MKPDAQRIAIAEACGWTEIEECTCHALQSRGFEPVKGAHKKHLPDYLNDLNAMHEVEKVMTDMQKQNYLCWLGWEDDHWSTVFNCVSSTAAQRAEAFLRTIGKWEDD